MKKKTEAINAYLVSDSKERERKRERERWILQILA